MGYGQEGRQLSAAARTMTTLRLRPQSIAMAVARWILILVVVVATIGVGAHVGEITYQWRVGGGLATGQQRQLWSCDGGWCWWLVGGWWLSIDYDTLMMLCVVVCSVCRWSLARCGCLFVVFEIQQRTKYS